MEIKISCTEALRERLDDRSNWNNCSSGNSGEPYIVVIQNRTAVTKNPIELCKIRYRIVEGMDGNIERDE